MARTGAGRSIGALKPLCWLPRTPGRHTRNGWLLLAAVRPTPSPVHRGALCYSPSAPPPAAPPAPAPGTSVMLRLNCACRSLLPSTSSSCFSWAACGRGLVRRYSVTRQTRRQ